MNRGDDTTRFILVSKVAHPWFDEVVKGAQQQAEAMSPALHQPIEVLYLPPAHASAAAQQEALVQALATEPAGIALDPVESAY